MGDRREGSVLSPAGLDAGLLVGAQNVIVRRERHALPDTFVEIENPSGFFDKSKIARKNPTAEAPWTERVAAESTPQGRAADFGHDPFGQHFAADFRQGKTQKRQTETRREFAGQCLNLDDAGGKAGRTPAAKFLLEARQAGETEAFAPLADDLTGRVQTRGDNIIRYSLGGEENNLGPDDIPTR
jgi:hypothetical protein